MAPKIKNLIGSDPKSIINLLKDVLLSLSTKATIPEARAHQWKEGTNPQSEPSAPRLPVQNELIPVQIDGPLNPGIVENYSKCTKNYQPVNHEDMPSTYSITHLPPWK